MSTIITGLVYFGFGLLLALRIADHPPKHLTKHVTKWWADIDQLPDVSRKGLYVLTAALMAASFSLTALLTFTFQSREDSLEASLRQCEDRKTDANEEEGQPSTTNPTGYLPSMPGNIGTQQESEQARAQEGYEQPQEDTTKFIAAASINSHGNDKQHQVDGQRFSGHAHPSKKVTASITQGGAA